MSLAVQALAIRPRHFVSGTLASGILMRLATRESKEREK